jgi:hypothetical protein
LRKAKELANSELQKVINRNQDQLKNLAGKDEEKDLKFRDFNNKLVKDHS